jgi:hypothetical protein
VSCSPLLRTVTVLSVDPKTPPLVRVTPVQSHRDAVFPACIDSFRVVAMLDSGSTRHSLTSELFTRLNSYKGSALRDLGFAVRRVDPPRVLMAIGGPVCVTEEVRVRVCVFFLVAGTASS